ncbi:MAG: bifunctional pyr operon transcriptional regulator/uracil phosphoribosyltransferase PyrR [Gammaproteobacteria bacterium]
MSTETIDFDATLKQMATEIKALVKNHKTDAIMMVGIRTGGIWIAQRLHDLLKLKTPLGELNISFYRDDFSTLGLHPEVKPSKLPVDITDKHIILVDDVFYTGRTIRAAMNEIFDYGRPASIRLAVLIDRNEHELPISADVIGKSLTLNRGEHVKLSGPEPLALEITRTG